MLEHTTKYLDLIMTELGKNSVKAREPPSAVREQIEGAQFCH